MSLYESFRVFLQGVAEKSTVSVSTRGGEIFEDGLPGG
jgi:hypothetical protein